MHKYNRKSKMDCFLHIQNNFQQNICRLQRIFQKEIKIVAILFGIAYTIDRS